MAQSVCGVAKALAVSHTTLTIMMILRAAFLRAASSPFFRMRALSRQSMRAARFTRGDANYPQWCTERLGLFCHRFNEVRLRRARREWHDPRVGNSYHTDGAPTGSGFTVITSNKYAFAALSSDGTIHTWGSSDLGGTGAPSGSGSASASYYTTEPRCHAPLPLTSEPPPPATPPGYVLVRLPALDRVMMWPIREQCNAAAGPPTGVHLPGWRLSCDSRSTDTPKIPGGSSPSSRLMTDWQRLTIAAESTLATKSDFPRTYGQFDDFDWSDCTRASPAPPRVGAERHGIHRHLLDKACLRRSTSAVLYTLGA